ncbi:DUF5808 domain-containing protein [Clostridium arbusti]|uniref:DUF5808 domain-containing protein n=1 Tax=Clostridium arbusti TaxID=1137848 RepID=UPI0002886A1B|nr:DUF5808 domain-containing protein [Clostridium arbusti]
MNKDNDSKHWKLGIFYYNKDNPAEFVDKRNGIGTTPNFASKSGRLVFSLIFVPVITAVILLFIIMYSK